MAKLRLPTWPQSGGERLNLAGVSLRGLSMVSKLALVLYAAEYLPLADLGAYGLVVATNALAVYVLGFQFHTYVQRKVIRAEPGERARFVRSQVRFHALTYAGAALLWLALDRTQLLPSESLGWLIPILVGSHLSHEAERLLVAISRPSAAYLPNALAHGVWVWPAIALGLASPAFRHREVLFASWAVGAAVGAAVGLILLAREGLFTGPRGDWSVVGAGVRVAWPFFLVALGHRMIDYTDRYFLEWHHGEAVVGIYTFHGSVARILNDLVYVAIVSVLLPGIVSSGHQLDPTGFLARRRQLRRWVVSATGLLLPGFVVGMYVLLAVLGLDTMRPGLTAYQLLLAAALVSNLALVPHYTLYARHRDRAVLAAVLLAATVNLLGNFLLVPRYGLEGAALSTLVAVVTLGGYEWMAQRRELRP